jgi:putative transposase
MIYSLDLRARVIGYIENGGRVGDAVKMFNVSYQSIWRWRALKEETNSLKPKPPQRKFRKIDPEVLRQRVRENPDYKLSDHAKFFGVREQSICEAFKRLKITRKKRLPATKSEMKKREHYFWSI